MTPTPSPRTVSFRVLGIPKSKGSLRAFLPEGATRPIVTADNPAVREWQRVIATVAQSLGEALFVGAVSVVIVFRLPRPKSQPRRLYPIVTPDLDRLVRAVFDGLTGVLIPDDAVVVEVHAAKYYADAGTAPCASITLSDIPFSQGIALDHAAPDERTGDLFAEQLP